MNRGDSFRWQNCSVRCICVVTRNMVDALRLSTLQRCSAPRARLFNSMIHAACLRAHSTRYVCIVTHNMVDALRLSTLQRCSAPRARLFNSMIHAARFKCVQCTQRLLEPCAMIAVCGVQKLCAKQTKIRHKKKRHSAAFFCYTITLKPARPWPCRPIGRSRTCRTPRYRPAPCDQSQYWPSLSRS